MSTPLAVIDQKEQAIRQLSRKVWEFAEVGLQEHRSAALLADALEAEGFEVERGVAGMPTAFVASFSQGTGQPVIGILGEYDALPGLSQDTVANRSPFEAGKPGHGCGHNLLGTAGIAAVLAVKASLEEDGIDGTIRYYGCPAEETLVGKVFMVRDGLFDDVDAALTWHPGQVNMVDEGSSLAMNSTKFRFSGVAAHAAANPDAGRSALDAVELMNVGANYLREHVPDAVRIHYVITNGGGEPNVVPPEAEVWYYVRAPRRQDVEAVYKRLQDIARGAALMTGTEYEEEFLTGCYNYLHNRRLGQLVYKNMREIGAPAFSKEEKQLASEIQAGLPEEQVRQAVERFHEPSLEGTVLHEGVLSPRGKGTVGSGSTDVGDVSWVVPLSQFNTACAAIGTPGHSWQNVILGGMSAGEKGMLFAGKIMAATALDLVRDEQALADAKAEFKAATSDQPYQCAVPADLEPPLDQLPEH